MDKETKKRLVLKIENWVVEKFNQLIETNIDEVVTFKELIDQWNLNERLKVDDQMMRSAISRAKKRMHEAGFIVVNKRSVGYKVANKFEALDEREAQLARLIIKLIAFNKPLLNNTLSEDDINEADSDRQVQYTNLVGLIKKTLDIRHELESMANMSPTYKKNKTLKLGTDLDVEMRIEDFDAIQDDPNFVGDKYI